MVPATRNADNIISDPSPFGLFSNQSSHTLQLMIEISHSLTHSKRYIFFILYTRILGHTTFLFKILDTLESNLFFIV